MEDDGTLKTTSNYVDKNDDGRGNSIQQNPRKRKRSSIRGDIKQSAGNKPEDKDKGEGEGRQQSKRQRMDKRLDRRRAWDGSTKRDRNVDSRGELQEGQEMEKEERRPKKKVACFIGYSGEGYHGMQQ